MTYQPTGQAVNPDDSSVDPRLAAAVPEAQDGREAAPEVWLPGMLATIWWAVDDGPIGVNHAMRRDSDWVACGDVAVPDRFVVKAERIVVADPSPYPDGLNHISGPEISDFTAVSAAVREGERERLAAMKINDRHALEDLLLDANYEHGETPELAGYDKVGRPVFAWLFDGGDDAPMRATLLGGEDAGRPELVDTDPDALLYPVTVLLPESWTWLAAPSLAAPEVDRAVSGRAKRKTLADAWDEGALAESKAWVALVSWAIKDGTRATAPQKTPNPYRAASPVTAEANNERTAEKC